MNQTVAGTMDHAQNEEIRCAEIRVRVCCLLNKPFSNQRLNQNVLSSHIAMSDQEATESSDIIEDSNIMIQTGHYSFEEDEDRYFNKTMLEEGIFPCGKIDYKIVCVSLFS